MKRLLLVGSLALLLVLLAAACGGPSPTALPTPGPGGETIIRVEIGDGAFSPSALTIRTGRKYLLELRNRSQKAHNLRIAGLDGRFDTDDDLVSEDVGPGNSGSLAFQIDTAGVYDFRSDAEPVTMVGTLTVWEPPTIVPITPTPSPSPEAEEPAPMSTPPGGQ